MVAAGSTIRTLIGVQTKPRAGDIRGLIHSRFVSSFSSAQPAETLLMTDVGVVWHPVKTELSSADTPTFVR